MAMLMLFQGSKHDENRVQMAGGPRGANCTPHAAQIAPREIRPEMDTSAECSADLLHGSDRGHHPELDHPKPSAKRTKPSRLPLGYLKGFYDQVVKLAAGGLNARRPHGPELGHLQICRPLKLRSWVNAGAAHPANARSVTRAFPTTGKPVDTRKAGNVAKAGNPALADFLNLRGCVPIARNPSLARTFPQPVEKPGRKQKTSDVARNLVYLPSRERDARDPRQDARDALRAANELTHLLPWRHR